MKHSDPFRMLVVAEEELAELSTKFDMEAEVSYATSWKLRLFRLVHPIGIHYMVPLKRFDPASKRLVDMGTTCWWC